MKERILSDDQKKRIKAIKEEWAREIDKIEPAKELKKWPDDSINVPYRELEKKYYPRIKAILDEK